MKKFGVFALYAGRHLASTLFDENGLIKINKICPTHGEMH